MGIEFAAIPPVSMLETFPQKYHLVLAHLLHNDRYCEYYKERSERGDFIILDNSAYENGHSIDIDELVEWAHVLNANEVAMPDVLYNAGETIYRLRQALRYINQRPLPERSHLMIVPQAQCVLDWQECMLHMKMQCAIHGFGEVTIGIPKHTTAWKNAHGCGKGRIQLINFAARYGPIHLLGTDDNMWELEILKSVKDSVRSVDSSKPIVLGLHDVEVDEYGRPITTATLHRQPDYFDINPTDRGYFLARYNVHMVRRALLFGDPS